MDEFGNYIFPTDAKSIDTDVSSIPSCFLDIDMKVKPMEVKVATLDEIISIVSNGFLYKE